MSAINADLARPGATLDDVQGAISNLFDLLEVLFDQVTDAEFKDDTGPEKSRVLSLVWVARDIAKRTMDELSANSAVIVKARQIVEGRAR